uniref:Uncharacterized protein n=1 Tax=Timema poppense TaxID=170557 RepID=A0A7R9D821_TIMPO|nr:unnamed protein product [Timema poppensis]
MLEEPPSKHRVIGDIHGYSDGASGINNGLRVCFKASLTSSCVYFLYSHLPFQNNEIAIYWLRKLAILDYSTINDRRQTIVMDLGNGNVYSKEERWSEDEENITTSSTQITILVGKGSSIRTPVPLPGEKTQMITRSI